MFTQTLIQFPPNQRFGMEYDCCLYFVPPCSGCHGCFHFIKIFHGALLQLMLLSFICFLLLQNVLFKFLSLHSFQFLLNGLHPVILCISHFLVQQQLLSLLRQLVVAISNGSVLFMSVFKLLAQTRNLIHQPVSLILSFFLELVL